MNWYSQYRGESIGRILSFINEICGLHIAEQATIGKDRAELHGKLFATFKFIQDGKYYSYPVFEFENESFNIAQRAWDGFQEFKREDRIRELTALIEEQHELLKSSKKHLDAAKDHKNYLFESMRVRNNIHDFLKRFEQ